VTKIARPRPFAPNFDVALGETNLLVSHWDDTLSLVLSVG